MRWQEQIKNGMRALWQARLRSFLSALGIIFAVFAVMTMLSIGEGAKEEILQQIQQLGPNSLIIKQSDLKEEQQAKVSEKGSQGLTLRDLQLLGHLPFLSKIGALKIIQASLMTKKEEFSPEILAVTPSFGMMKGLSIGEGRFLADGDLSRKNMVCVLGEEIAKSLGKQGRLGKTIRLDQLEFEIVGILEQQAYSQNQKTFPSSRNLNRAIFIPLSLQSQFVPKSAFQSNQISEIFLMSQQNEQIDLLAQLVRQTLLTSHRQIEDFQVVIPKELLKQAEQAQQTFNLVLVALAAISLLVGGIGIMNIMLAAISERTKEIGIRRAVGANRFHIASQFLIETITLSVVGAFLGILLGILASQLLGLITQWHTVITGWSLALSLGMATIIGILSGLYPAFQAAKMDPIKALRYE